MRAQGIKWARCARCGYATYICARRGCETREEAVIRQELERVWHCTDCDVDLIPEGEMRACPSCGLGSNARYLAQRERVEMGPGGNPDILRFR